MALPDELLVLARELADRNPLSPAEADLRMAVVTAYYALFHLLITQSVERLIAVPSMRPRVMRSYEHRVMRFVCEDCAKAKHPVFDGIPKQLQDIAFAFVALQDARQVAQYDLGATLTLAMADKEVARAEQAFRDWAVIHAHPAADTLLTELLSRHIRVR